MHAKILKTRLVTKTLLIGNFLKINTENRAHIPIPRLESPPVVFKFLA